MCSRYFVIVLRGYGFMANCRICICVYVDFGIIVLRGIHIVLIVGVKILNAIVMFIVIFLACV